jgi:hypothetical protein
VVTRLYVRLYALVFFAVAALYVLNNDFGIGAPLMAIAAVFAYWLCSRYSERYGLLEKGLNLGCAAFIILSIILAIIWGRH